MPDENVTFVIKAEDKASGPIGSLVKKMDEAAKKGGLVGSVFQGVGQQLGKMAFGAVTKGIGMMTGALGDGIRSAIDEEKSLAKLTAALKANVPGWDGQTAAIDKRIAKGMELAFSDDELRASLTTLVTRSGNVEQAFKDQGLAMDYARFKGIDLASASGVMAKALGGNLKALKEMGIVLRKGATEAEIFAAVQAKVAGQAEAFANTTEGAMKATSIAIDEVFEGIAQDLLPTIKDMAIYVRTDLIPTVKELAGEIGKALSSLRQLLGQGSQSTWKVGKFDREGWADIQSQTLETARETVRGVRGTFSAGGTEANRAMARGINGPALVAAMATLRQGMGQTGKGAVVALAGGIRANHNQVTTAMLRLKWLMLNPISTAKERIFLLGQLNSKALARGLRSKDPEIKAKAEETRNLIKAALEALKPKLQVVGQQAGGAFHSGLSFYLNKAVTAADIAARRILYDLRSTVIGGSHVPGAGRQHGGPMSPGGVYQVGEVAQETVLMHPGGGATVIPHGRSRGGGGGGNTTVNVHFHTAFAPSPSQARAVARVIAPEVVRELVHQRKLSAA